MKLSNNVFIYSIITLVIIAAIACNKTNVDDLTLAGNDAEFAFPLFSTSLSVKNLLEGTLNDTLPGDTLIIDDQGRMTIVYSGDVAEKTAAQLYPFLDGFASLPLPIADSVYYAPFDAPASIDIYRADFKSGQITILGQNNFTEPITGTFYIPQLSTSGIAQYKYDFNVAPGALFNSPTTDLNGWKLTTTYDSLKFAYQAYLPNGERVKLNTILVLLQEPKFSYLEGYWGNEVFPIDRDTIEIDINKTNFSGGDIRILDPRITVTVFNSYGFPTRGRINALQFEGQDGIFRPLESQVISNGGIDFGYPSLSAGEVGQSKSTTFYFTKTNSNIDDIFNSQPISMDYLIEGIANADQDPTLIGFVTDSSIIRFNLSVELPIEGTLDNFGSQSDIPINFGSYQNSDIADIQSVEFKLVTENGMPLGIKGQIFFKDDADSIIDSLFTKPELIMKPAPVDNNGTVTATERTDTYIPISSTRFEAIRKAKKAYVEVTFATSKIGNPAMSIPVKILANMQTAIKMGVKVKLKEG